MLLITNTGVSTSASSVSQQAAVRRIFVRPFSARQGVSSVPKAPSPAQTPAPSTQISSAASTAPDTNPEVRNCQPVRLRDCFTVKATMEVVSPLELTRSVTVSTTSTVSPWASYSATAASTVSLAAR